MENDPLRSMDDTRKDEMFLIYLYYLYSFFIVSLFLIVKEVACIFLYIHLHCLACWNIEINGHIIIDR